MRAATTTTTVTNSAFLTSPRHIGAPRKTDCARLLPLRPPEHVPALLLRRTGSLGAPDTLRRSTDRCEDRNVYRTKGGAKALPLGKEMSFPDSYALVRACVRPAATTGFRPRRRQGSHALSIAEFVRHAPFRFQKHRPANRRKSPNSRLALRRMIDACFETHAHCELANGAESVECPVNAPPLFQIGALAASTHPMPAKRSAADQPVSAGRCNRPGAAGISPAALLASAQALHRHTFQHRPSVLSTQAMDSPPLPHTTCALDRSPTRRKANQVVPYPWCLMAMSAVRFVSLVWTDQSFGQNPRPPMPEQDLSRRGMKRHVEHDFNEE